MTTIVSNAHASTIWAHVEKGPLARPNPEETLRYFTAERTKRNINENVAVQTLDYRLDVVRLRLLHTPLPKMHSAEKCPTVSLGVKINNEDTVTPAQMNSPSAVDAHTNI